MEEIKEGLANLKSILKFYHGEPIRKIEIDRHIENIEKLLELEKINE